MPIEGACLLRPVIASIGCTVVPYHVNVMNVLFVLFEVLGLLPLVVASVLVTVVPVDVNTMHPLLV